MASAAPFLEALGRRLERKTWLFQGSELGCQFKFSVSPPLPSLFLTQRPLLYLAFCLSFSCVFLLAAFLLLSAFPFISFPFSPPCSWRDGDRCCLSCRPGAQASWLQGRPCAPRTHAALLRASRVASDKSLYLLNLSFLTFQMPAVSALQWCCNVPRR